MKVVDNSRYEKAKDYVQQHYTIRDFLISRNYISKTFHGNDLNCFDHDEKTPSMKVDWERNRFNCFACPAGGGFVEFVCHYNDKIEGKRTSKESVVESLLKQSRVMQQSLGFNSIYVNNEIIKVDFGSYGSRRINKAKLITSGDIYRKYKDKSLDTIMKVVSLVQEGLTWEEVEELMNIKKSDLNREE